MTQSSSLFPSSADGELPSQISTVFLPLCQALPAGHTTNLKENVSTHLQQVKAGIAHNEFLDLQTAVRITDLLHLLLDRYAQYDETQQALIVGAARYFIKDNDAAHDTHSFLGLDDDVTVLNYVLDKTGHTDKKITL